MYTKAKTPSEVAVFLRRFSFRSFLWRTKRRCENKNCHYKNLYNTLSRFEMSRMMANFWMPLRLAWEVWQVLLPGSFYFRSPYRRKKNELKGKHLRWTRTLLFFFYRGFWPCSLLYSHYVFQVIFFVFNRVSYYEERVIWNTPRS